MVKELFSMWNHSKMMILVSITAGLYAALLIPFKMFQILPGITELRPATCIPIVCSLFFGPAAAWGGAVGNLIGDFAGQFGPGSPFGIIGNFLYGFIPYRVWRLYKKGSSKKITSMKDIFFLIFIIVVSSGACATSISWGLLLVGLPFVPTVDIIFLNNVLIGILLVPLLCNWLDTRIFAWHLNYEELLDRNEISANRISSVFLLILIILISISFVIGHIPFFHKTAMHFQSYASLSSNPFVALILLLLIIFSSLLI